MSAIAQKRCSNHRHREAAACCPQCNEFFCRECIVEHDDRVLCANCLAQLLKRTDARRSRWGGLIQLLQLSMGFLLIWFLFHGLGRLLLALPSVFHDGTWLAGHR
jgi:uncharacterized paraquat-inducible protein A